MENPHELINQLNRLSKLAASNIAERQLEAGKLDRTTASWAAQAAAGDISRVDVIQRLRQRAWYEFRNNMYANKAVRAIVSRLIGNGVSPESIAVNPQGEPLAEFRTKARKLWDRFCREPSDLGRPGRGGITFHELSAQVLTEVICSGECFLRLRRISKEEQAARNLRLPLTIQVIEAERVSEAAIMTEPTKDGTVIFRGIELDADTGKRLAYHVYSRHPNHPLGDSRNYKTVRIQADEILHVYVQQRPSQLRGFSWLSPVLLNLRDINDYQFNELVASAVSSCIALAITREPTSGSLGLQATTGGDNTDSDGNAITRIQPGTLLQLNPGEKLDGFDPNRPAKAAENFINHLLRGVAAGLPGVKSSQITGDYRASSFSSERSAENDIMPEIQSLQNWFYMSAHQPIYEAVIDTGVMAGYFGNVPNDQSGDLCLCDAVWRGPVSKSINPNQDENASMGAIKNGTSSAQIEAARKGHDWRKVIEENAEVYKAAIDAGLPESYAMNLIGVGVSPVDTQDEETLEAKSVATALDTGDG
ncbi:phage portal protein [Thalassoroseus pseudoceratinae]|uniref:phage portal protein n=1 Tax=Thalassoroseus pseudoceratinae TaxID=2713176 RepID=UPI001422CD96|nr:phage portal protein [Thalassoroseus pseudoceratinae]